MVRMLMGLAMMVCTASPFANAHAALTSSKRSLAAVSRVRPGLEKALGEKGLLWGAPIFMRIIKETRQLEVWMEKSDVFVRFRTYNICNYSGVLGPKLKTGDLQAPEGFYFVSPNGLNPNSRYHLSFNLGYPNAYDRHHGRTGSALMVHGGCYSIGCFAMTDPLMEEVYALADAALRNGQRFFRVHIFPFHMNGEAMGHHRDSQWLDFWNNLKQGYEFFESKGRPPNVLVRDGRYFFQEEGGE